MSPRAGRVTCARAALLVGVLVWFVAAVDLFAWIRPLPLLDPDLLWAIPRLTLGLFVIAVAAAAGGLAGGGFLLLCRAGLKELEPQPLAFSRIALALLSVAALVVGAALRFVALDRLPPYLWVDDVSLISPALELKGQLSDFANAIRPAPYGVPKPYGSVGVLYLEAYRCALRLFGTNVFGVRFLSAAAGVCSIGTALLLGRALLPRGGGMLAALVLAGLRWNLLLSRWGWVAIMIAPVVDIAGLLLLRARRRESLPLALAAGLVCGIGAHIYLAAWVAAAALGLLALWPRRDTTALARRLLRASLFAAGFLLAVSPLFLFREGRVAPYFARASDHNVLREIRTARSPMPILAAVADSLAAPWFLADPAAAHDLPGKKTLGWILGVPVAFALMFSLARPREESSAFLLSHAVGALSASVVGGQAGLPNNYRFAYLADVAAVAAAAGIFLLLALGSSPAPRSWSMVAVGLVAVSGALGARDALVRWPESRETFDGLFGQDTMIARAMLRWERYGEVVLSDAPQHSLLAVDAVRRHRLDPDAPAPERRPGARFRRFRVDGRSAAPGAGERVVERVRDAWARDWAVVLGSSIGLERGAVGSPQR